MKRSGSALLIVLGMMAFMIVSAVAFSAYMRRARLPSSYLRSSGASRLLAKAALARAIDAVDKSIANNPHPGVGHMSSGEVGSNRWNYRVLCTTNDYLSGGANVSVLTLEGLAYIPPPLVNDVRYMAQRTATASWHQLGFDVGRYAFCAVDVSDYFDVNRMAANVARSSSPGSRISLAYLFEGDGHKDSGSGAKEWDEFMANFRTREEDTMSFKYDSKVPLVSVADLNLALGSSGKGGLWSPFCRYIEPSGDSGSGDGFYGATGEDDYKLIRRMTFVTDSWFPNTNNAESDAAADGEDAESDYDEIYDLNDPQCQPFTAQLLGGAGGPRQINTTTILDIMSSGQKAKVRLLDSMPTVGLIALFDYLDKDHVPVSLACPTLERTPMICGLKPTVSGVEFLLKLDEDQAKKITDEQGNELKSDTLTTRERSVYATYEYKMDTKVATSLGGLNLQALLAYPFAHDDAVADTTFDVEARATLFFSVDTDPVRLRTGNDDDKLHVRSKDGFGGNSEKGLVSANGTIVVPFQPKSVDFGVEAMSSEEDALFDISLKSVRLAGSEVSSEPVARIRYKWTQKWNDETQSYSNQTKPANAAIDKAHCGVCPLSSKGEPDTDFKSDDNFLKIVTGENAGKSKVTMKMALAVRVVDSNGKTVDLVPAHTKDDKTFNNVNNSVPFENSLAGNFYPLMLFEMSNVKLEFSATGLDAARAAQAAELAPKAVRVDDPRYNYAPESWYDANGDISKDTWLKECGRDKRDGDIFLATSDQGYLQSIYELAFLPRFSDLESVGGNVHLGYLKNPDDGRNAIVGKDIKEPANADLMWRTYRPFATVDSATADDFEGLGFTSAGTGFKVNPYSTSTNVLMAVFANTPVDWRMASTNNSDVGVQNLRKMKADEFNRDYAWNEYSTDSKFAWSDLEAVAGQFMWKMREYQNWKNAWRNLGWRYDPNDPDRFCGITLSEDDERPELWGVDRKFFYGFWRDCFAVKQQLFLIFVRAEPMMMGSGFAWSSTHQLGARAVALVWRDPSKTTTAAQGDEQGTVGYPHRTRILFYRQLE